MNSFGDNFRLSIWGESHGSEVGVVIDGVAAGVPLSISDFMEDLRRRGGGVAGTTPRREADTPHITSGLYNGHTTGAPIAIRFENTNQHPDDYTTITEHCRPSHADLTARRKWSGMNDPRGGGHLSGRLTVCMVAAGVVAKKSLGQAIHFDTRLIEVGGEMRPEHFEAVVAKAHKASDSVGGVVECRIGGVGSGTGEPLFDSIESVMSHLLFAIPGVKGVEFGEGFGSSRLRGSQNNDPIINAQGETSTNHDGGINGGISNGNQIVVRVAFKPTASIALAQQSFNFATQKIETLTIQGRHDTCIALRGQVVVEAMAAIALAELTL